MGVGSGGLSVRKSATTLWRGGSSRGARWGSPPRKSTAGGGGSTGQSGSDSSSLLDPARGLAPGLLAYQVGQAAQSRFHDRSVEQEKLERRRQMPFHMHVNLELLESVHLVCSMLQEVPYMANSMRRARSNNKPFARLVDNYDRQTFNGPPENVRDHVMAATRCMLNGEWRRAKDFILGLEVWALLPGDEADRAKVLDDAARLSVPRELVERNIKRATDGKQADYMELTYEAYGEGGVGIVIEVLSDNVNRAAAETKSVINKNGGKVAEIGSVLFNFERKGVITIDCDNGDEEAVFEVACENGGDDVVPREDGEDGFTIFTEFENFMQCQKALGDAGYAINPDETALKMIPLAEVDVTDEQREVNDGLVDKLLELEDVDAVYTQ